MTNLTVVNKGATTPTAPNGLNTLSTEEKRLLLAELLQKQTCQTHLLSFSQDRLWFLHQLDSDSTVYNLSAAQRLTGCLHVPALQRSIQEIVRRHAVLRTTFQVDSKGVPAAVVATDLEIALPVIDMTGASEEALDAWLEAELDRPFDLAHGPLVRTYLLKIAKDEHILVCDFHHIIFDGYSYSVWNRELSVLYSAFTQNLPSLLRDLPLQYHDFARWQREHLAGDLLTEQVSYWKEKLGDAPPLLTLPTDRPRLTVLSSRGRSYHARYDPQLTQSLKQLSREAGVTLFVTLQAALVVLLTRYSRQNDVVLGTPVANRNRPELEPLIGFLVNTLALRHDVSDNPTLLALLQRVQQTTREALAHSDLPFEKLVDALQPERSTSYAPIVQVVFSVVPGQYTEEFTLGGLTVTPLAVKSTTAKLDLTLYMEEEEEEGELAGIWEYNTDLFDESTIARMATHFEVLLRGVTTRPEIPVHNLPWLSAWEQQQLLAWNATETEYPKDQTLVDLFERQVEQTPDHLAVVFEDQHLTYAELNARANQLAHYLLSLETPDHTPLLRPDTLVAICVERSLDMVIGLLGILKAGAAYVPIDPGYPAERIAFMLDDSAAPVLLTETALKDRLPLAALGSVFAVMCPDAIEGTAYPATNPVPRSRPDNLAYVIYTSGSTGRPKGVMVEHGSVLNLTLAQVRAFHIDPQSRLLQFASFSFDASVSEMMTTLSSGASLFLLSKATLLSDSGFGRYVDTHALTHVTLPPSFLNTMAADRLTSLQTLIVAGEACPSDLVTRWAPGRHFINAYGPTEATVCASVFVCEPNGQKPPIGRPIANTRIYLLDAHHQPLPPGIPGELCIAGAGLARGYLNRPELTAERFIEVDLFGQRERIYKTGDLARWLPDGNLEYLGRLDHQVKLRGFRIELGEIEAVLAQHAAVREAVAVLYQGDDNPRLAAYVTVRNDVEAAALPAALTADLQSRLPDYMVPAHIQVLDTLPLTPNGKIDRKALPAPEGIAGERYELPRNEVERQLAEVWAEILKRPDLGIHDNFFALGGDSILSIQIVARARQRGMHLTPRDLFAHQTIAALAGAVRFGVAVAAEQGLVRGEAPLTPIQRWFFTADRPEYGHFNQSMLLRVPADLSLDALRRAFTAVLCHHDALRLRYTRVHREWQQRFERLSDEGDIPLHTEDLRGYPPSVQPGELQIRTQRYQASLDLAEGPLTRLVLFHLGDSARLFWCIHHLAVDGMSWRVLLEDLHTAYLKALAGQPIHLPAKTSSFKAWAERLARHAESDTVAAERAYWQALPVEHLPVDHPLGANRQEHTRHYTIAWDPETTRALLEDVPAAYHTRINDVLLTALALTLCDWTGEPRCLIDLEGHGRVALFEDLDLSRTVGWFTTIHPVALSLPAPTGEPEVDLGRALKAIKEHLRGIPQEGIGYGLLIRLRGEDLPRGELLFNYLGQFDQRMEGSLWAFADEPTGSDVGENGPRQHLIDINGAIRYGQLWFTWSYSGECYRATTIERLADNYRQHLLLLIEHCQNLASQQPKLDTLLPLQKKGELPPLFCMPGLGSKAGYFHSLANLLGESRPVYGLESPGLNGHTTIPATVEALAQHHLQTLRQLQPTGPYYLLGHSFGAAVALELAWQLEQAGETIALLAIVDQSTPKYTPEDNQQEQKTEFDWIWNIVDSFRILADVEPPISLEMLKATRDVNYAYTSLMGWLKQHCAHEILFSYEGKPEEFRALVKVYQANALAFSGYCPTGKTVRCAIDLFCTEESINTWGGGLPETWGWEEHTQAEVNIIPVPGAHFTMMKEPHVRILVERLKKRLEGNSHAEANCGRALARKR